VADVARAIDELEAEIRTALPVARVIYIEPDIFLPPTSMHPSTDAIVIKGAD
jgi:hypothetical protein